MKKRTFIFALFAASVLSCEIPTDGNFGSNIRGTASSAPRTSLAAPKNVRAAEGEGAITIIWDEVPEADGYNVYRSKGASSQVSLRGGVSLTEYSDSGKSVAPNTPYYYFVSAYKGALESAMSPSRVIELSAGDPGILPAPEITGADLADGSDNSITLTWTEVAGAAGYRIYRSSNYDDKQYIFRYDSTATTYPDTSLMPGEYIYQVSAVDSGGQEGYLSLSSDWVEIEPDESAPSVAAPVAPQSVRARIDGTDETGGLPSVTLTWQAAADATKYYVLRSEDGETYTEIGYSVGETSYVNKYADVNFPVGWGGIYYYRVKPYNGTQEGYLSAACGPVVITPAKPEITGVSGTAGNITLNWTIEGKADGFRVYRSANNVQYEILKTAGGNERTYTDTAAGVGTYYYRITAYNSGGVGLDSDPEEVDVTEQALPSFVPVSGMSGVPDAAVTGVPLTLQGTVEPPNATNTTIVWTVKSAGGTGAAISGGNTLTATTAGTVTVTATIANGLAVGSAYTKDFTIAVSLSVFNVTDSTTLASALSSIGSRNAVYFTIIVEADFSSPPVSLTDTGYNGKTIVLKGDTPTRTVSLSSAGSLFTVGEDVTLELEDIVLQGRSDNNTSLVWVNGGELVMNEGAKVAGNRASQTPGKLAGGVTIKNNGSFTMNGGEISDNGFVSSAHDNGGAGGVEVWDSTFIMYNGKITNNTPTSAHSAGVTGGVSVNNSIFTMYDGEISHNTFTYTQFNAMKVGGVSVWSGSVFTMYGGKITGNTETGPGGRGWGAGGVLVLGGSAQSPAPVFNMHGGVISANKSVKHTFSAGGVCLERTATYPGVFIKDGGVLYGSDADPSLANTTGRSNGAAVYSTADAFGASPKSRNASLYENDNFDSRIDGAAGGWE